MLLMTYIYAVYFRVLSDVDSSGLHEQVEYQGGQWATLPGLVCDVKGL